MANSVEEALNRMDADKRAEAMQKINEASRNILDAQVKMGYSQSSDAAATIAQNEQIIEEAKRSIPVETMKSVDEISPPMTTPRLDGYSNPEPIELNSVFHADIESVQRNGGNNYLNQNAVDRALARQAQESPQPEPPQQEMMR